MTFHLRVKIDMELSEFTAENPDFQLMLTRNLHLQ